MSGRPEERHNSTSHRSHRNRSRSPKSKKEKSSGHHQTQRDDKRKTDSKQRAQKKEDTQRGIEQAKSRLKSSLSSAINDTRESGSSDAYPRRMTNDFPTDFVESVTRQAEIDRIEGPGFNPAAFKSNVELKRASLSAGGAKNPEKGGGNTLTASGISSDHDRAMFGPLWASKEIEKKQALMTQQQKQQSQTTASTDGQQQQIRPAHRFPLAHERLSEDPEVRNQRWLELFKQRRKMALEGTLTA